MRKAKNLYQLLNLSIQMFHGSWKIITILLLFLFSDVSGSHSGNSFVGINIGSDISNLPSPSSIISILQHKKIHHVCLPDTDHKLLASLAKTGIEVMVSIPNTQIKDLGKSRRKSATYINTQIVPHLPETNITHIAVGHEVLTSVPSLSLLLLRALHFLHSALLAANLNIKISSPMSMDMVPVSFPPSMSTFNTTWENVMNSYMQFLKNTGSYFTLNCHPFLNYKRSKGVFPLGYALGVSNPDNRVVDPNTMLEYGNMFDAMVDAVYFAMDALNFTRIPITVTATGWPWYGEADATVENAMVYNSNLIRHVLNGSGTPSVYIYELFDEDLRVGSEVERHWGVFEINGTEVYSLSFDNLPENNTDSGPIGSFCVAKADTGLDLVKAGLDWACGPGLVNCSDVQPGGKCYGDGDVRRLASYVFDSYYHMMGGSIGACNFNGAAVITHVDPSYGACVFAGSGGSTLGGKVPGPSGSTSSTVSGVQAVDWCYLVIITLVILFF